MGAIESPIMLTGTQHVGRVADALQAWAFARDPEMGVTTWGLDTVVGECSDMYLSDVRGRHVRDEHVFAALDNATGGPVEEGAVGGGTGMVCFGFKGGIGTSSRVVPSDAGGFTVGVLVMSNFGRREHLTIAGVPVGRELQHWSLPVLSEKDEYDSEKTGSSIIIVLATDAPLDARQLHRLSVRAGGGLARMGGLQSTSSGDFVIAFSTTNRTPHHPTAPTFEQHVATETLMAHQQWPANVVINWLFEAATEATEEAILNSLCMGQTTTGRDDRVIHALPLEEMMAIMKKYGR
jgi:D-aminopeptidase